MQISMTGRTGFITGGSDGMGRAMALKFAGASASVASPANIGGRNAGSGPGPETGASP